MRRSNLAFKNRHHRFHKRNTITAIQQKRLLAKAKIFSLDKKDDVAIELKSNEVKAKIQKLSNVSDISDWMRKNKKEEQRITPDREQRPYRKFEKTTQDLIHWQALYLINNGLSFSRTAQLLNIHRNTASLWWRQHLNSDTKLSSTKILGKSFKHLTPEMKSVLIKQLFVFKEEERIQDTIAGMLTLINDDLASKWLQAYNKDTYSSRPVAFSNYKVELSPLENNKLNLANTGSEIAQAAMDSSHQRLIPAYFKTDRPNDSETTIALSPPDKTQALKKKAPIINKLKKLIGLSEKHVSAEGRLPEEHVELNNNSVTLSEKDLPSFYLADPEAFIQLRSNTKIIKEKDYAMYCESADLLQASKDYLQESKVRVSTLEKQAIESAKLKAEEIIEQARIDGQREAENLLAEKSIEATKASIEHLASLENSLPEVIMSIVRKIIIDYDDQEFVINNIKAAVKNLGECEEIKIHISPNVISDVNEQLSDATYAGKITLIPDSSLKNKDCLIVTNLGVINACLETQLQKIESEMVVPPHESGHKITVAF